MAVWNRANTQRPNREETSEDSIARLMRIVWDTLGRIVARVIAERLDPRRLDGLRQVGVDKVSFRRRHRH